MSDKTVCVTTYINPDTDGVCSALCYSYLLKKKNICSVPVFFGSISSETKLVMEHANCDVDKYLCDTWKNMESQVVIVDTHNSNQLYFIPNFDNVTEIIDHHPDGNEYDFPNAIITNMKIGAVASIIAEYFIRENLLNKDIAFMLGCAIISNTNNFKAPSTSEFDKNVYQKLSAVCKIPDAFIEKMLIENDRQLLSDLKTAIQKETKSYRFRGEELSISQLELKVNVDDQVLSNIIETFFKASSGKALLNIVDYSCNRTIFVTSNENKELIKVLFPDSDSNIHTTDEICLRKTFILPKLKEYRKIGVIHGRFQGLHVGHMEYLEAGFERCDYLYVGITECDRSFHDDTKRTQQDANPFSYRERADMLTGSLIEAGYDNSRFSIVPFPIEEPEKIKEYTPIDATYFLTIYDNWGEEKLSKLQKLNLNTEVMWRRPVSARVTSGTEVRSLIKSDDPRWKELVPNYVSQYIIDNGLDKRIRGEDVDTIGVSK